MFELPLSITLFTYVIHMGLSSILLKFDNAKMEHGLCFLINKQTKNQPKPNKKHPKTNLNFFKQKDNNISWISELWELLRFIKSKLSEPYCQVHLKNSGPSSHVWGSSNPQTCSETRLEIIYPVTCIFFCPSVSISQRLLYHFTSEMTICFL